MFKSYKKNVLKNLKIRVQIQHNSFTMHNIYENWYLLINTFFGLGKFWFYELTCSLH